MQLFWENFWVEYRAPNQPENVLAMLRTILGGDETEARKVVERSQTEEVKHLLLKNTDDAFNDGAFGLPWFVATNAKGEKEGFFGVDQMGVLCDFLGLERPVGEKRWRVSL